MEKQNPDLEQQSSYLKNQLLIAMPNLNDPYFEQSVTLICQHNEDGCFGLTINHPMQVTIAELFEQLNIPSKNTAIKGMTALQGGPVQVEQGFIVHDTNKKWENTLEVGDGVSVTASRDILFDIAAGDGPDNFLLVLGCASWAAGQVEAEMMSNSWLNCPIDKKILFNTPYNKRWTGAIDTLGIDVNAISGDAGHA